MTVDELHWGTQSSRGRRKAPCFAATEASIAVGAILQPNKLGATAPISSVKILTLVCSSELYRKSTVYTLSAKYFCCTTKIHRWTECPRSSSSYIPVRCDEI